MRAAATHSGADAQRRILRATILCLGLVFFSASTWGANLGTALPIREPRWEVRSKAIQESSLPAGPGKEETGKVCSGCHELAKSFSVRQDRAGWQVTLEKMISLGAKATDKEFDAVLEYLVKHFPAEATSLINVNKATAVELEAGLSLKRSEAAAIIKHRGEVGKFKSIEELKRVPGIDVSKIEAKKSRLTFEE